LQLRSRGDVFQIRGLHSVDAVATFHRVAPPQPTLRTILTTAPPNHARLPGLGEFHSGAGRGTQNMVYVTWSTGVGGGLILDGKLFSGAHGSAGEIGHTILDPDGPLDTCGQHGCVEVFCGGRSLAKQTGKPASQLFESAAAGD